MLIETYKTLKGSGKSMELVFCSLDNSKREWEDYTSKMPWLCLPFGVPESQMLAGRYGARGIPHLVVIDGKTSKVITMDGTDAVMTDPKGSNFPWKPKSLKELWPDQILAPRGSSEKMVASSTLKDKYLMLYFSAHWCPPCRAFTPKLSAAYTKLKAERGDDFELVFVSSDKDEDAFDEYHKEMTFCALPFECRDAKKLLSKKYDVTGIPKLIMLGPVSDEETFERPIVNKNARGAMESGDFSDFPFGEKNYGEVDGAEDINDVKCLVVFHEGGDDDEQDDVKEVLKQVGEQMKDKQGVKFLWALSTLSLAPKIRSLCKMPATPSDEAAMVILDIPDKGGYYKSGVTDITVENVLKFLESPGPRLQLTR